jgi:hypothetical protein
MISSPTTDLESCFGILLQLETLPMFMAMMTDANEDIVADVSWVLCNFASTSMTDAVWEAGLLNALITAMLTHPETFEIVENGFWGVANMASHSFSYRVTILQNEFL